MSGDVSLRQTVLEELTRFASLDRFENFAIKSRSDYDHIVGGTHEDDPLYEMRMVSFMEWLIFDAVHDDGRTIFQIYSDEREKFSPEEARLMDSLEKQWRDIFTVKWSADGQMKVTALRNDENIIITDAEKSPSFRKGDLFSGRAFKVSDVWFLTNGVCIHPSKALKTIKKDIKQLLRDGGGDMTEYLMRLTAMSVKWERFRNIDVSDIYKPMEG